MSRLADRECWVPSKKSPVLAFRSMDQGRALVVSKEAPTRVKEYAPESIVTSSVMSKSSSRTSRRCETARRTSSPTCVSKPNGVSLRLTVCVSLPESVMSSGRNPNTSRRIDELCKRGR